MILCKTKLGYFNLVNCVKIDFYYCENQFKNEVYEAWECVVEFDSNKIKLCTFESKEDAHIFIGKIQEIVIKKIIDNKDQFEKIVDITKETNRILQEFCA